MPLSAKITTKVAEYKNPDRSNYARIHNPENKKRRYTLCLTLIVLISWSSPVPARLWISSRWRPPMTCVYLHHLKNCRKNVIKIYLNRRIRPQRQDAPRKTRFAAHPIFVVAMIGSSFLLFLTYICHYQSSSNNIWKILRCNRIFDLGRFLL